MKLFQSYYQSQLASMDTNPQLQQDILTNLQALPAKQKTKQRLLWLGSAVTVLSGSMIAVLLYVHPKTVTADALLRQALATPTLQVGQIYQASSTTTTADGTTYTATISDGKNLEKLSYDGDHKLTGAELDIPHGSDNTQYDVYAYGEKKQSWVTVVPEGESQPLQPTTTDQTNVIEHILAYNDDLLTNVSSDDPSTYKNMPDGFIQSFGQKSVLEVVSGSSFWRPYVSNDTRHMTFFVEPIITETTLNGVAVYKLDENQPNIGFQKLAWVSKQDGRLLQEQTVGSDMISGDLTVYSEPTITTGTMPVTVAEFITALHLTNASVKDYDYTENTGDTYSLPDDRDIPKCGGVDSNPEDDTVIIDDGGVECNPQQ